jgi:hypothetical protein
MSFAMQLLNNESGEFCANYPLQIIIPELDLANEQ